jgi:RND family efflux transporter MFP subunit
MNYRWIFGVAVLVAYSSWVPVAAADSDVEAPSVLVTLTALQSGSLARTVTAYGVVQAAPSAQRAMMASTSQTVSAVYVHAGDEVASGAPLLELVPSPQTGAAYTQAQSALRMARQLTTRTQQMFAQHLATAQQLADAQKAESDAHANLGALQAQGAGGADVLRAPFRAIVLSLSVSPGTLATAGTPLLELAKPAGMMLKAGVAPAEAGLIELGDKTRIEAVGEGGRWLGTVLRRGAMIDPASGLVPVQISLPADQLLPGQTAQAIITVGQTQGYVVPHTALLVDDHGKSYVVQADRMKARKVPVQVLGTQGDEDVIRGEGLNADQPLVLSGNYQLDDGMNLRVATQGPGDAK